LNPRTWVLKASTLLLDHCKLLAKIIRHTKILHYSNQILRSNNKSKTVWDIVKSQTGRKKMIDEMSILDADGSLT